jgi:hypothetical protein
MRTKSLTALLIALLAAVILTTGCARRHAPAAKAAAPGDAATSAVALLGKTFAVAPFTSPATDADLLSGYLPSSRSVPEVAVVHLDAALAEEVAGSKQNIAPAKMTAECARTAARGDESGRLATMRYWQNVGKCAGADFVLVPMVLNWREREGSEMGATRPASVDLTLTLVDVRTGGIVKHYHFDETQQSLSSNILEAQKFVSRNGRWVTAMELAQEGLRQGLKELGL